MDSSLGVEVPSATPPAVKKLMWHSRPRLCGFVISTADEGAPPRASLTASHLQSGAGFRACSNRPNCCHSWSGAGPQAWANRSNCCQPRGGAGIYACGNGPILLRL